MSLDDQKGQSVSDNARSVEQVSDKPTCHYCAAPATCYGSSRDGDCYSCDEHCQHLGDKYECRLLSARANRPYRVGHMSWPKPDDPAFETIAAAEAAAEVLAARDANDAIAVWDGEDNVVVLYLGGEEFTRRNP